MSSPPIHWYEGLFLQPHHLQTLQRQIQDQFASERRLAWAYPYGLVEARLSTDELENMRVRFDRLRVVMPSGIEVHVPDNADLPALDIKKAFEASGAAMTISLGIPLWFSSRANTIDRGVDDWRIKRLYRQAEVEIPDENTGENPQTVVVRRLNARLLLDDDDRADLEVLPILRIVHGTGEDASLPRLDPAYIPPTMVLAGCPSLRDQVRDLANQVEASRKELVVQITRGGFSMDLLRGTQFEQLWRLRTLNRYGGRLPQWVEAPGVTPFEVYLELRSLLGELAALYPDRDPFDVPAYDHDNPSVPFAELLSRVRALLRGPEVGRFLQVPFTFDPKTKVMVAVLTEEHLTRPVEYFLGIKSRDDPRTLAKLVEDIDKFKLMPRSLAHQRVWGVRLVEERHPPVVLPAQADLHYYRLLRPESARMWERVQEEKAIAARWPGVESTDYTLTLYMIIPVPDAEK